MDPAAFDPAPARRVLVVEDEVLLAEELRDRLERAGYRVVGLVDTADDAVATARAERPDLILMDIQLRGAGDGIAAALALRADSIPIVFVTAHSDPGTLARTREVAKYGYVLKPFRERELLLAIDVALHRHDIERQLRAEQRATDALFRTAFEHASIGVSLVDADGYYVRVNPQFCALLGYREDELVGQRFHAFTYPDDIAVGQRFLDEARRGEAASIVLEKRYRHRDGHLIWVELSSIEVRAADGRVLFINHVTDVTERRRAERERAQLVEGLRGRVSELELLHRTARALQADRPLDAALLAEIAALIPRGWWREERCAARITVGEHVGQSANWSAGEVIDTASFVTADGRACSLEIAYATAPTADERAELAEKSHLLHLLVDRLRQHAEQDHAARTIRRLDRIHALSADFHRAVLRGDPTTILAAACRIAVDTGGYRMAWIGVLEADGTRGSPVASAGVVDGYLDLLDLDLTDPAKAKGPFGRAAATGTHALTTDIAGDPRYAPWREAALARGYRSSGAFPFAVGGVVEGVFSLYAPEAAFFDADELALLDSLAETIGFAIEAARADARRREVEATLRASERLFASAFEHAPIGVALVGLDGRFLKVNRALCELTGYTSPELMATTSQKLTHPDDRARGVDLVRRVLVDDLTDAQRELRYLHRDGHALSVVLAVSLVRDATNAPQFFVAQLQDVTARRQIEEQLRQAQKLEAVGRLAGGIAHDFNNMLCVIMACTDAALADPELPTLVREDLHEVNTASQRAAQLTRQLLAFSRRQLLEPRVLDLAKEIRDLEKMLRSLLRDDIELQLPAPGSCGPVFADATQLAQIVMNLAVNARDAMPRGGRLAIETGDVELDEARGSELGGAAPGRYVRLSVTDTGIGMDAETRAKAFEPFFTTKEVGKGTGLGLSMVFGSVKQSEGFIELASELGRGTTIAIYLPHTHRKQRAGTAPIHELVARTGDETILLVDDDEQVRTVTRTILARHGYTVLVGASPGDALLLAEQHRGTIDLLVSDVVMPRMSGPELVARLTASRTTMKVLLVSGYADDALLSSGLRASDAFLQKPYMADELLRKVREVLDRAQ